MTSMEFCCRAAACVPATKNAVCGNLDRGPPKLSLTTSKLHMVLLSYANREGIPIIKQKAVSHVSQQDAAGIVTVTFGDGTQRQTRVLFGADGAHSRVRSFVSKSSCRRTK